MKAGDHLEIITKDGDVLNGLVMPSKDNKILSLKLDSGYNINLDKKKISKSKVIQKKIESVNRETMQVISNPKLKTITILHTGGTISSRVSYSTGAVSPSFNPEDLVAMFPELKVIANIKSRLIGNMFSEDMRFSHYNLIAKEIEKELKDVDGVIVTHGTDTLAYTSAALSFALENLNKPVILVGAQRSSDRPSSDAAFNVVCAANFIVKSSFNDVGICMHGKSGDEFCYILPACKTKKLHTSRRDAFKVVNGEVIAKINKNTFEFLFNYKPKEHKEKLKLKLFNEKLKIGILRAHPNMFAFEVTNYNKFDGVVLEGAGLAGAFPINVVDKETQEHKKILGELNKLAKKIPLVVSSNCIFGRVNMNVYDTGRKMQEARLIGNLSDMFTETAFVKLAWLLSNYKKKEVEGLFMHNFRGELSSRMKYEEEFV